LGCCNRSEITSAESASAIATIPSASQRGGVTAAISAPSATQLSADSATVAASPPSAPRPAQASANAGAASRASHGRAPCISQPSASAASGGTPTSATYVSAVALAWPSSWPTATKPITDSAGTSAHQALRSRPSRPGDHAATSATTAAWHSDRIAIDSQNGSI
jgi:hypothetical protein